MSQLYSLLRRYGCSTEDELIAARDAFGASIAGSEALEERISALEEKEKAVLKDWERFCAELSESRRAAAPRS